MSMPNTDAAAQTTRPTNGTRLLFADTLHPFPAPPEVDPTIKREAGESHLDYVHRLMRSAGLKVKAEHELFGGAGAATPFELAKRHTFDPEVVPDDDRPIRQRSTEQQEIDDTLSGLTLLDAYNRWIGKRVGRASGREVMVSCPFPDHADDKPSASINVATEVGNCHACGPRGFDLYTIGGIRFGLDTKGDDFLKLRRAMAMDLGWTPPAEAPAAQVTPQADEGTDTPQKSGEEEKATETPLDVLRRVALTTAQLATIPAPEPLIDGLLYRDSLAVLYGPSTVGKSFVAIDWAMHVASDAEWWHGNAIDSATVVYAAAEGASGVQLRTDAWREHFGHDDAVWWIPQAVNIFTAEWADGLGQYAAEIGAGLVVVDTLARSTVGAKENATEDMTLIVEHCDRIRRLSGACVLLVHHTGKDAAQGSRGNSALKAGVDTEIELSGSSGVFTMQNTKQKNAATAEPMNFRLQAVGESAIVVGDSTTDQRPQVDPLLDDDIEKIIFDHGPLTKRQVGAKFRGDGRKGSHAAIDDALERLQMSKRIHVQDGKNQSKICSINRAV